MGESLRICEMSTLRYFITRVEASQVEECLDADHPPR